MSNKKNLDFYHVFIFLSFRYMKNIICIEGPTGSGKSTLAIKLAKSLDTEIISADSRQVYKYLNIGTAKPDIQSLSEVKHHLIDIITPDKMYSAGAFMKDAKAIINNLHNQNKIPIICGGSMLYIKCLLEGISEIPEINEIIKKKTKDFMKANNLIDCYQFVQKIDPKFANSITPTDKQRISRAIEVWFAFEKPLTSFWGKGTGSTSSHLTTPPRLRGGVIDGHPFKILINRERNDLYDRINKRMRIMINRGLIEEIKSVLKMGYKPSDSGLNSVGYKEFMEMVSTKNNDLFEQCIELATQHTRNYAKRQITWYRKSEFNLVLTGIDVNIPTLKENILQYFANHDVN